MATHALVKDGIVVNIIEVSDGKTTLWQPPEGHSLVPTEGHIQIGIGDAYDGSKFSRPNPLAIDLAFHAGQRRADIGFASHRLGDVVLQVHVNDHPVIARLAERAKNDPTLVVELHQRFQEAKVIPLNANQIIALNEKITDYYIHLLRAEAGVIHGIRNGVIVDHGMIDHPPASLPQWPQRYLEPAK
jgi:hypothetical protein